MKNFMRLTNNQRSWLIPEEDHYHGRFSSMEMLIPFIEQKFGGITGNEERNQPT